jgi:c-di-GMP-binding flagellar brake protein YcgR
MFAKGNFREDVRTSFVKSIRFSVPVSESKLVYNTAVSVDISDKGLGILTTYPLEHGQVVTFEDNLKVNNMKIKEAVVRWSGKFNDHRYRVGLRFI